MTFLQFGVGTFLLGLAVIAGLLYLLQRLRVKYREVEVVTTMFWKQAVEETRARVLVRRFRHPLAYLLALAIGALIWLALAEPRWDHGDEGDYVLLLDASAGMDWGDRFDSAKALVQKEAARLPAERRRVYICGADARLVLDRGEEAFLLEYRLKNLKPEASPASIERELLAMASTESKATNLKVFVVGDAQVSDETLNALPGHINVERLRPDDSPVLQNNRGIAAIGVAEAASGAFDRVDVMIDVTGGDAANMAITLGGESLSQPPTNKGGRFFLYGLPANGEVLEVALTDGDPLPLDNRARITLPSRPKLSVILASDVNDRFRMVIIADPALTETADGTAATVAVGGPAESAIPNIAVAAGNSITVIHEDRMSAEDLQRMRETFAEAGLDRVGRKITNGNSTDQSHGIPLNFVSGSKRGIQIGGDLLTDDYDFAQSSAFPIFVSSSIRWLANADPVRAFARAGEPLPGPGQPKIADSTFAPPRAGDYPSIDGSTIAVSLPTVVAEAPGSNNSALEPVASATGGGRWPGIASWAMLGALVLIGGEWWLFQKGRIP